MNVYKNKELLFYILKTQYLRSGCHLYNSQTDLVDIFWCERDQMSSQIVVVRAQLVEIHNFCVRLYDIPIFLLKLFRYVDPKSFKS